MAQDYARVLGALDIDFEVIGRGVKSSEQFEKVTGQVVRTGGVVDALRSLRAPDFAIVAVGVEDLSSTATELVRGGVSRIMIEKPGGVDLEQIETLYQVVTDHNASVVVGYNRRFYGSVQQAREYISEDGGLLSAHFEFTERSHLIESLPVGSVVKERWVLGNSSHVIDLAFHLIGCPVDWRCWHAGSLDWHSSAARFAGSGVTDRQVMFSYFADWQAPGRWGIDLMTSQRRLVLRPMEALQVIPLGAMKAERVDPPDGLDSEFKPGLYRQTAAFLKEENNFFCTLQDQVENSRLYSRMAGYV